MSSNAKNEKDSKDVRDSRVKIAEKLDFYEMFVFVLVVFLELIRK